MIPKIYKGEQGYLDLLYEIMLFGVDTPDRTDVGSCRKLFNQTIWFDLRESFPVSTVRPCSAKKAFKEFWFFMSGETNTKKLEEQGVYFWQPHTSREFLDSRGMSAFPEGSMGDAYGGKWRGGGEVGLKGVHVDQLYDSLDSLKTNPYSRRNLVTFLDPVNAHNMALIPCFHSHKFNVEKFAGSEKDVLHLSVFSRSSDLLFGGPFNYQQYAIYLKAAAQFAGMEAGRLVINLDDVHIYENQQAYTEELLLNSVKPESKACRFNKVDLKINKELATVEDVINLKWEDLEYSNLKVSQIPMTTPKPKMAV